MKRKPVATKADLSYPTADEIAQDRRGFLRLVGKVVAGLVAMGPLARTALAEDDPKPRLGGKVAPPEDPVPLGGEAPLDPEPPIVPRTGGVLRRTEEPSVICDPESEDCEGEDPPRHPGTKPPPKPPKEPPVKAGVMPVPKEPKRLN
jgi:hypothetical protein